MSKLETNIIAPSTGTTITIGESGDTVALGSGATQTGFGGTNTPSFLAYLGSTFSSFTNDATNTIPINTEIFDTNNCFNTSNYTFTPTIAGKYFVYATVTCIHGSNDWNFIRASIEKNGSTNVAVCTIDPRNASSIKHRSWSPNPSVVVDMNGTTDYLKITAFLNVGSTSGASITSGQAYTYFGAYKIIE